MAFEASFAGPVAEGSMEAAAIELRGVTKSFQHRRGLVEALGGVDLTIHRGEFVAVIGPSGCGKSTLLNMTAGLMAPTSGKVLYESEPVTAVNRKVGYVTQRDDLLPWRTVHANIALPLEIRRVAAPERDKRARDVIRLIGLEGFEHHYPSQLSGGMRKRVNFARTLVYEPQTLLLDEPFAALDAQLRLVLQQDLLELLDREKKTVVLVTHDIAEAAALADRVVVISARPGRIRAIERVPLGRPRDLESQRFSPELAEVEQKLWTSLRTEVRKGTEI